MSNTKLPEKFNRFDSQIWKRSKIDSKGRTVIPKKIRRKLNLNGSSQILWINVNQKNGRSNEFLIHVGVKR